LLVFFHPAANGLLVIPFEILGFQLTISHFLIALVFVTGVHYNVENIYYGFVGASDKLYALYCLVPYIQIYILVFCTSYSQFFDSACLLLLAGIGIWQTYVVAYLNLSSIASLKVSNFFYDPILYSILLTCDIFRLIPANTLIILYTVLIIVITLKYLMLITSVCNQLTTFLGISLLRVKDKSKQ